MVTGRHVSMGVSAKPPCEVTRTYAMHVESTALQDLYDVSLATEGPNQGQDMLRLPWRASVAISITPRERLMLSFEQEFRPYKLAHYVDPQGKKASPWLPSFPFRVECQYQATSWLALREGLRDEAVVFEPEGNHIPGEAPTYSVYSCGAGKLPQPPCGCGSRKFAFEVPGHMVQRHQQKQRATVGGGGPDLV